LAAWRNEAIITTATIIIVVVKWAAIVVNSQPPRMGYGFQPPPGDRHHEPNPAHYCKPQCQLFERQFNDRSTVFADGGIHRLSIYLWLNEELELLRIPNDIAETFET
jgi:hypothetical protein